MEEQKQPNRPEHEKLEEKVENSVELSPLPIEPDILSKIEAFEREERYFEAAILSKEQGYTDRALENYKKAAEKHHQIVYSMKDVFGKKISFPKKHKIKIRDWKAIIKLCSVDIDCNKKQFIPNLKIKIKGPGIKASYGGFSYLFMHYINPFTFLEGNLAIKSLKEDISEKYKREINREFLEQLVNEAIIPYEPKNY